MSNLHITDRRRLDAIFAEAKADRLAYHDRQDARLAEALKIVGDDPCEFVADVIYGNRADTANGVVLRVREAREV